VLPRRPGVALRVEGAPTIRQLTNICVSWYGLVNSLVQMLSGSVNRLKEVPPRYRRVLVQRSGFRDWSLGFGV